jgi:chemotaxis protein histidine kinase CheA
MKVEIYKLANSLKKRMGDAFAKQDEGFLAPSAIAEADKLIAEICATSPETIAKHLETLEGLWKMLRDGDASQRQDTAVQIFATAHEIKDIGAMCGYDLLAYFAESLRDYIERTELNLQAQVVIVQAHLDAMKVVHQRGFRKQAGPEAEELKLMVQKAIDKYH